MAKGRELKNIISVGRIVSINCVDLSPDFITTENRHGAWELVYVDSGSILSVTEERSVKVEHGQLVFHRPEEIHSTVCNRRRSARIFTVIFECESPAVSRFDKCVLEMPSSLRQLFHDLTDECDRTYNVSKTPFTPKKNAPTGGEQLTRIYLEAFLIRLLRTDAPTEGEVTAQRASGGKSQLSERIAAYLEDNLFRKVTLDDLSRELHFGKVYLCDVFKRDTGCSIMNYLLDLKLDEAKRMLRESDATVSEISERLGFESPAYFSRVFKRRVGHPPKSFRKMLISDTTVKRK